MWFKKTHQFFWKIIFNIALPIVRPFNSSSLFLYRRNLFTLDFKIKWYNFFILLKRIRLYLGFQLHFTWSSTQNFRIKTHLLIVPWNTIAIFHFCDHTQLLNVRIVTWLRWDPQQTNVKEFIIRMNRIMRKRTWIWLEFEYFSSVHSIFNT